MARLRYTRIALLVFGLGLVGGLVVVAGEYAAWERAASATMALGLLLIPLALFADGHGMALVRRLAARLMHRRRTKRRPKPRAPAPRRRPARAGSQPARRRRAPKRRS